MPTHRYRTARNLGTLALHSPFVAAHRLTHGLASSNPLTWWLQWQSLWLEKWFAGVEAASAMASASLKPGTAMIERMAGASLVPLARRVRRNSRAIQRTRTRSTRRR